MASGEATKTEQTTEYPSAEANASAISSLANAESAIDASVPLTKAPKPWPLWTPKAKVRILRSKWQKVATTATVFGESSAKATTIRYQLTIVIESTGKWTRPGDPTLPERYMLPPKGARLGEGHWIRAKLPKEFTESDSRSVWVRLDEKLRITCYWDNTRWPAEPEKGKTGSAAISMRRDKRHLRWLKGRTVRVQGFPGKYIVNDWGSGNFGLDLYSGRDVADYRPVWVQESVIFYRTAWTWTQDK